MPPFTVDLLSSLNLPAAALPADRLPTRTIQSRIARLLARQDTDENIIIPAHYGGINPNLSSVAVAGIVLGSVGGFLLLLWLLYGCCAGIGPPVVYRSEYGTSRVTVDRSYRSRSSRPRHSRRHSSGRARVYATETTRVRETSRGGPVIVDAEPVPMQERTRSVSRAPPPPRVVDPDSDDEVVVIEENTPPRRSRRQSSRYDERRRSRDY